MRFVFDGQKSAQAAAYLLKLADGEMHHIHLMKLLYLADRQSLIETGYPITGARMVSTDNGPALSEVYSSLAGDPAESAWNELIADKAEHRVGLRHEPDWQKLSKYEMALFDRVFTRWGRWSHFDLVKYTSGLPEWHDPDGSSMPIDVREILIDAGKSPQEIDDIAGVAESVRSLHQMMATG